MSLEQRLRRLLDDPRINEAVAEAANQWIASEDDQTLSENLDRIEAALAEKEREEVEQARRQDEDLARKAESLEQGRKRIDDLRTLGAPGELLTELDQLLRGGVLDEVMDRASWIETHIKQLREERPSFVMRWRGDWSGLVDYQPGDVVRSGARLYVCVEATVASKPDPSKTTPWLPLFENMFVSGPPGPPGPPGDPGGGSSLVEGVDYLKPGEPVTPITGDDGGVAYEAPGNVPVFALRTEGAAHDSIKIWQYVIELGDGTSPPQNSIAGTNDFGGRLELSSPVTKVLGEIQVSGAAALQGDATLESALAHTGNAAGFFAKSPVNRPAAIPAIADPLNATAEDVAIMANALAAALRTLGLIAP